jgi:hypothetical protein
MDIKAEREIIKKEVDLVDDVRLLEAIRKILEFGLAKSPVKYQELSEDDYFNRVAESRKAIADGKLITQEEAIEYFRRKDG